MVMRVNEAIDRFVDHCRIAKRLSPHTLRAYATDLSEFSAFLGDGRSVDLVDRDVLRGFARHLFDIRSLKETTVRRRMTDTDGEALPLEVLPLPDFVMKKTSRGTPMIEVGQMFNERLALEIYYGCINSSNDGTACQFCELGAETSQSFTDMADIRELVAYCESSASIPMRHVLIGGGTPPESQWSRYFEALSVVRQETALPIYMMLAPPNDIGRLEELHARGLSEIGMNVELFDRALARRFMPAKGKLPLRRYWDALERAVSLWGSRGAVRSILIVGLEPLESTLAGVEELCRRGVMPILSPYRPVPGTPLAHCPPPSPEWMYQAWTRGQEIAERYGQVLGPTCIACQNNTIAMPVGDRYHYY